MEQDQQPGAASRCISRFQATVADLQLSGWQALASCAPVGIGRVMVGAGAANARFQKACLEVQCLIRTVYRHSCSLAQIETALLCAGLSPQAAYSDLSAGYETEALARFTEALGLPQGSLSCWSREAYEVMTAEKALAIVTEAFAQGGRKRRGK